MINRREFIQVSAAGSLVGAMSCAAVFEPAASIGRPCRFHAALFDERFSASARFGIIAQRAGIKTCATRGDVTKLWYDDLGPRWKRGAVPIAGVTTYAPLFCLERLAWDHGMRVAYQGVHDNRGDGTMEHMLSGTEAPTSIALAGTSGWADAIATFLTRSEFAAGLQRTETRCTTSCELSASDRDPPLYSWVIAPRATA